MIRGLLEMLGGLGLLLFGLRTVSEALQVLFGERLRRRVATVGSGRRAEFDVGVVAGLVTQSSAAAAVRIVSFVNAGLMSLAQAASVLVGANLGATVAAWLLALQPGSFAIGLLGAGASVHLLADRETARFGGALTMGAGMLFVAIGWLSRAWLALGPQALPLWMIHPETVGPTALLAAAVAGALATAVLQSATATVGVAIALATAGDLSLAGAATLVIGANVGSCVTVLRAAAPANADGRAHGGRRHPAQRAGGGGAAGRHRPLAARPRAAAQRRAGGHRPPPARRRDPHRLQPAPRRARGAAADADRAASPSGWSAPPTANGRRCAICARAWSRRRRWRSNRRAWKSSTWRR